MSKTIAERVLSIAERLAEKKRKLTSHEQIMKTIENRTKQKKKRKNLFDVLNFLPNFGVGAFVRKRKWHGYANIQITKIKLGPDGRHGKAYGIKYWKGFPLNQVPKRILQVHKYIWRYVPEKRLKKYIEQRAKEQERLDYIEKLREQIKNLSL